MNDLNNHPQHNHRNRVNISKKEKTLLEIVQIIFKNKYILIGSVIFFLIAALIYSFTVTPKYDSTAILKKERNPENSQLAGQDISSLLNLQSLDEIETEIQLVTTHSVIGKVVDDLDLFCSIESIKWGSDKAFKIKRTYLDIIDPSFRDKNRDKFLVPNFFTIGSPDSTKSYSGEYYIRKEGKDNYSLYRGIDNKHLASAYDTSTETSIDTINQKINYKKYAVLNTPNFYIKFNWSSAPVGSEIRFNFNDFIQTVNTVTNNTGTSREGKTDIFSVSYTASSALAAAVIANKIVDSYRESRLAQKKDLIRSSFEFVDKQLGEAQDKLKESENQLSSFKASGQIMTIDASSQELIGFLSNLEAEKLQTDLQLSEYRNKALDIEKEMKKTGFIDQTNLTPGQTEANSPFSQLMKQLADEELQRLELLQKRTESHPDVIALDDQIKLTKSKLAGFNENTLTSYKIMINTLEKKLLKITDLMSKYEVKMRGLPSQENKLAQLMRQKGTYERIFTILLDQREAMRVAELSKMQDITIVDEARIPLKPFSPNKTMNVISGILLGFVLGLVIILFVEIRRSRFINLDELESEYNTPILSIIPTYSKETIKELASSKSEYKIATLVSKDDGVIETYRLFRTKLFQKLPEQDKIIMITSCEENSGKTSVTSNLAVSLSQEGKRVLLVDCDLRKADLSKSFGITTKETGLIDFLTKDVNPKIYSRASKLIDILPAGGLSEESGTLLNSTRMKLLFSHLNNSNYDIIIFDTPPVTRVVDPLVMTKFIKNVVLVIRPKHSLNETVRWGMQELRQSNVNIIGMVANAADIENSYYYRYRYGYGYGYGKDTKSKKTKLSDNIKNREIAS